MPNFSPGLCSAGFVAPSSSSLGVPIIHWIIMVHFQPIFVEFIPPILLFQQFLPLLRPLVPVAAEELVVVPAD